MEALLPTFRIYESIYEYITPPVLPQQKRQSVAFPMTVFFHPYFILSNDKSLNHPCNSFNTV